MALLGTDLRLRSGLITPHHAHRSNANTLNEKQTELGMNPRLYWT